MYLRTYEAEIKIVQIFCCNISVLSIFFNGYYFYREKKI